MISSSKNQTPRHDRPMHAIRHAFNMVEITLALGVVAIGVLSVLALFPVGANASRDAIASTYAAEAADELLHLLENNIRATGGWADYVTDASALIQEGPPVVGDYVDFDATTGGHTPLDSRETLWKHGGANAQTRRFKLYRYVDRNDNNEVDPGSDIVDFEGIMVVWRSQVSVDGTNIPYDNAVALNAEITWPARADNAEREKKTFYLEIFKKR